MTLTVYDKGSGPHMHALIIGIGGYPHLDGGTGDLLPDLLKFGNPGQLTSPPRSALAVAAALQSPDLEWVVPLGTIDLLVSPAPCEPDPVGDGASLDSATYATILSSFGKWWTRCDTHPENFAFFYVAGHGLEGLDPIVLASDFGEFPQQPWVNAFNVRRTREALRANRARNQIFLVDACRRVTTGNVEAPDAPAPALRQPQMREPDNSTHDLTMLGTSRGLESYGEPREPSYVAKALIAGLAGDAAAKSDGQWWIMSSKLSERFKSLMERAGANTKIHVPQLTTNTSFRLARLKTPPHAELLLSCSPDEATRLAALACRQGGGPTRYRAQGSSQAWPVPDVAPGACLVSATFANREYIDCVDQEVIVEPPVTRERVPVT
jgi:hypothetical protein